MERERERKGYIGYIRCVWNRISSSMDIVSEIRGEGKISFKNRYVVCYSNPCSRQEMDGIM